MICARDPIMGKVCIFTAASVLGTVGWWLGSRFGVMTAFMLSSVGNIAGIYVGYRIYRDFFS